MILPNFILENVIFFIKTLLYAVGLLYYFLMNILKFFSFYF